MEVDKSLMYIMNKRELRTEPRGMPNTYSKTLEVELYVFCRPYFQLAVSN